MNIESDDDVIAIPGQPGQFARRITVKRWQAAGSPPINSALRLYAEQLKARLAYENGTGAPADDPRFPAQYVLAHVRGVALDIDATPERVRALSAAGLVRPYSYEPWHWQEPGDVKRFPLVTTLPDSASSGATPFPSPTAPDQLKEVFAMAQYHWAPERGGLLFTDLGVYVPKDDNEAFALAACYGGSTGNPESRRLDSTDIPTGTWDIVRQVHLDIVAEFQAQLVAAVNGTAVTPPVLPPVVVPPVVVPGKA